MDAIGGNSGAQLQSIIERVENVEAEIQERRDDLKQIYDEAKGNGFDAKAIKAIVRRRKQDKDKLAEHEAIIATYMNALGSLADTPLGQSALKRAGA